jgi:curli production assembly/transport component CsgE
MVMVLIFVIGCSLSGRPVKVEKEKTGKKEPAEIAGKKQNVPKVKEKTVQPEEAKPAGETTGQQKDVKSQKPSPAEQKAAGVEEEIMQEIADLIIEETMTKIGHEFYECFFLQWKPPKGNLKHYNILITERASSTWGSLVEVNIVETTVWSSVLRPRYEEIEDAVKQAIEAAKEYLNNYEKDQPQTIDLVGSGI